MKGASAMMQLLGSLCIHGSTNTHYILGRGPVAVRPHLATAYNPVTPTWIALTLDIVAESTSVLTNQNSMGRMTLAVSSLLQLWTPQAPPLCPYYTVLARGIPSTALH